jgi:hypothetical protein
MALKSFTVQALGLMQQGNRESWKVGKCLPRLTNSSVSFFLKWTQVGILQTPYELIMIITWRHDTLHNDIQPNGTQHNDIRHNDTLHNNKKLRHSA